MHIIYTTERMDDFLGTKQESEIERELSQHLHALRALRRRHVIDLIAEVSGSQSVSTRWLALQIAGLENEENPDSVSGENYRNVYNALSQTHLPTLSRANILVYDPQRQTAWKGDSFALALLLLKLNRPAVETYYEW